MTIATEFSLRDRADLRDANARAGTLYAAQTLDEWLALVPQLAKLHVTAHGAAGVPSGQAYDDFLRGLLKEFMPHFLEGDDAREEFEHLVWLGEDADRLLLLAEHRAKLTPSERINLATPRKARKIVQGIVAPADDDPPITEKQFLAAFDNRPAAEIANDLIAHDQAGAKDLADAIIAELNAAQEVEVALQLAKGKQ